MTRHPQHVSWLEVELDGGPDYGLAIAPHTLNDLVAVLRYATDNGQTIQVWGGGTHSGFGADVPVDLIVSMEHFAEVEHWEPDDLTILVGAGARIADVEERLAERNQTLVMNERPGPGTVGGSVAAAISSLRRGRLYGVRERVLQVTLVTGDGRIVKSGGRVVKNVTGFDLHRLCVGAFGSLGVIVSVCLKLWSTPPAAATVTIDSLQQGRVITRPLALLEVDGEKQVFLRGTAKEVESQVARLGGRAEPGLLWPEDPSGNFKWSLRVPPKLTEEGVGRLPDGWSYVAIHDVGEIRAASPSLLGAAELREWAEGRGGRLVKTLGQAGEFDPWGTPPPGLDLQRRIIAEFDPGRVINPGRLPGGI